jgi:hypothetical protein
MIIPSWRDGWRRVLAAPAVVAGVFSLTLLAALPMAVTMRGMIQAHLAQPRGGRGGRWRELRLVAEFTSQACGLGTTFACRPGCATIDSISSLFDPQEDVLQVAAALITYLLAWTFLCGGILDRYARQRRTRAHGFFAASGVFFWRFLRLALISAIFYGFLFAYVRGGLLDDAFTRLTRTCQWSAKRSSGGLRSTRSLAWRCWR